MTRAAAKPLAWDRKRLLVAGASVGGAVCLVHQAVRLVHPSRTERAPSSPGLRLRLPQPLIDGLAGAVGEVAQIGVLYPLETIKVRCQADGISAAEVLRGMVRQHGVSATLAAQLFSGFAAAAAFSMLVGSVHWLSFCAARRAALDILPSSTPSPQPAARAAPGQEPEAAAVAPVIHVNSSHSHDDHAMGQAGEDAAHKTSANLLAALVGAGCTALVEAPVELFRHQAQAGLISGNLVSEMRRAAAAGGPQALWQGFVPFCLEAFPYDISELGVYSQLRDAYQDTMRPSHRLHRLAAAVPEQAWDLAMGGAAGAAAVLLSMPFDCIKTYMQTHTGTAARLGGATNPWAQFVATGALMIRKRGPGALYAGTLPRLAQQVPSATICWWAIQQTQKLLQPLAEPHPGGAAPGPAH